mgnify:CR=1 FL=1
MKLQVIQEEKQAKSQLVRITKESGIPLIGCIAFGLIDRGTNLLQVRATTLCNMNCDFCSTDAGPFSRHHKTNFIVDVGYLAEELAKIAKIKGDNLIIFLDSVGEPTIHPDFVNLVENIKKIPEVSQIVTITNGTLLNKEKIDELEGVGLDRINLSFHSFDPLLSKKLFGMQSYDVEKIKEAILHIKQSNIDLMLTPVYLQGVNDQEIEKIIRFCKEINCKIGLQNYETYKYSRKMKEAKKQTYWKFYKQIEKWEKDYGIKLKVSNKDLNVEKRQRIPEVFDIGDRAKAEIVCYGWMNGQMIGKAKNRCISINNCDAAVGDNVTVKIVQNKNNIYIAE